MKTKRFFTSEAEARTFLELNDFRIESDLMIIYPDDERDISDMEESAIDLLLMFGYWFDV